MIFANEVLVELLGKDLVFFCDLGSTLVVPIIFCGIQVTVEYGWRRFVLVGRRVLFDYSNVVPSGG
ncbi:hypothetical protein Hanom_Chr03g00232711 [Helianthus anomalus]